MNSRRKNIVSKYTKILRYCYEFHNDHFIDNESQLNQGTEDLPLCSTIFTEFHNLDCAN